MNRIHCFLFACANAVIFVSCAGSPLAENAAAVGPAKDALVALERSAFEAWKAKNSKFWDTFLSDKFVGYGSSGRLDKKSATTEFSGADCEIQSYDLAEEQIQVLAQDVALLRYRASIDGKCGGPKVPAVSWAASVFLREGSAWKQVFHAAAPVVDPKAGVVNLLPGKQEDPAMGDAGTDALLSMEKQVWEAWKDHDGGRLAGLTTNEISFINIFGSHFGTKAEALKDWSASGCDAKSVSVTNAAGTMITPTVGILRFRGTVDGTCFGQRTGPIWGSSIYVKQGDGWKWAFGINLPARW